MPREQKYKGFFIRVYESITTDPKFYKLVDRKSPKDWESVDRLIGAYVRVLFILARHTAKPGWAYDSDEPLGDSICARIAGVPPEVFSASIKDLLSAKLIARDDKGVWGIGEERYNYYLAPEANRRAYTTEYHKKYKTKQAGITKKTQHDNPQILPEA